MENLFSTSRTPSTFSSGYMQRHARKVIKIDPTKRCVCVCWLAILVQFTRMQLVGAVLKIMKSKKKITPQTQYLFFITENSNSRI